MLLFLDEEYDDQTILVAIVQELDEFKSSVTLGKLCMSTSYVIVSIYSLFMINDVTKYYADYSLVVNVYI